MENEFTAYVVEESDQGFIGTCQKRKISDLKTNDLLVAVHYSSLNYKDALSATGNKGVTRQYPHTPGIDAVGEVVTDKTNTFQPGDPVIVTSYDLGMNTDGGFAQYIQVPVEWALPLPKTLSMQESMILGTAGLTAGMCVSVLTSQLKETGPILVTGATGGVGSLAIMILSRLGYQVVAVSGKPTATSLLKPLGCNEVIDRQTFLQDIAKPLLKPRWAGAVDTVGGDLLANLIKSTLPLGVISCCGNAASATLNINVFPFILRGVSLVGVNSQSCPMDWRQQIWQRLASDWKPDNLQQISKIITLNELDESIHGMLKGRQAGRVILKLI